MAIWIDSLRFYAHKRKAYAHSIHANGDFEELIEFYAQIGLKRHWLRASNSGIWHFDVPTEYYQPALENGAILVLRKELLRRGKKVMRAGRSRKSDLMRRTESVIWLDP